MKDKEQGKYIPNNPNYNYKKIVEDFEKWLKENFCNEEYRGCPNFSEHKEVWDKWLAIKRESMLLK